jgi:hypothetical protein
MGNIPFMKAAQGRCNLMRDTNHKRDIWAFTKSGCVRRRDRHHEPRASGRPRSRHVNLDHWEDSMKPFQGQLTLCSCLSGKTLPWLASSILSLENF